MTIEEIIVCQIKNYLVLINDKDYVTFAKIRTILIDDDDNRIE